MSTVPETMPQLARRTDAAYLDFVEGFRAYILGNGANFEQRLNDALFVDNADEQNRMDSKPRRFLGGADANLSQQLLRHFHDFREKSPLIDDCVSSKIEVPTKPSRRRAHTLHPRQTTGSVGALRAVAAALSVCHWVGAAGSRPARRPWRPGSWAGRLSFGGV